ALERLAIVVDSLRSAKASYPCHFLTFFRTKLAVFSRVRRTFGSNAGAGSDYVLTRPDEYSFRSRQPESDLVGSSQQLPGALADDDAGCHCIAGGHSRHDGPIRDPKVFDSIDLKPGIDDRQGIASHFCSTCLMVVSSNRIADEVF